VVVEGKAVYLAHCASCHGTQLEGQPNWQEALPDGAYPAPPHDGSGHTWRHSDMELFEATKFGGTFSATPGSVSHMPAFENVLSDNEIWAALAFVKSRWPAGLQARQRLLTRVRSRRQKSAHEGHNGHAGEPVK
jgi:mono/diheme cytochrome c family protein